MKPAQIIIIVLCVLFIGAAILLFMGVIGPGTEPDPKGVGTNFTGSLDIWGVQPLNTYKPLFAQYENQKQIGVTYSQKNPERFTDELVKAIALQKGPDAVIMDTDWILANKDILQKVPQEVITPQTFQNSFVDAAAHELVDGETIWALPLGIDPLMLFWNKDVFNINSIPLPPKTWTEALAISNSIKRVSDNGAVSIAGIALGRTANIPHFRDIATTLLLQLGGDIENEENKFSFNGKRGEGESVLRFYTDFARNGTNSYTWNASLPTPRDLFAQGKLGMMVDYYSYSKILREKSPHLSFDIAPLPQAQGSEVPVYGSRIEAIAVILQTTKAAGAWNMAASTASNAGGSFLLGNGIDIPARRDLFNHPAFSKHPLAATLQKIALNTRRPRDHRPELHKNIISEMIEAVANGRLTANEALSAAKSRAAAIQ